MKQKKISKARSFAVFALLLGFLMIGAAYGTAGFDKAPQASGQANIQITGLQSTLRYLFNHAGQTVAYSMGRDVNVIASISTVAHQNQYNNVTVSFTTMVGNDPTFSTSEITNYHGNYYLDTSNGISNVSSDPGGTYTYYVTTSGAGAQTWDYWYVEHPLEPGWSSTSTADADSGIFTISWTAPFLIFILGLPETLIDWGWSASNNAGWGPYGNGTPTENDGTGGSNTLYTYFGYYSTVSINITWTYFGGYA